MAPTNSPGSSFDASGISAQVIDVLVGTNGLERLLVRSGSLDTVVELCNELQMAQGDKNRPKPGDLVLIDREKNLAVEKLPAQGTGELQLEDNPKDQYEDIAGFHEKIELIRDAIEIPYLNRKRLKEYDLKRPRGILLHGPPGCGKTMIGRAVANGLKQEIEAQYQRLMDDFNALLGLAQPEKLEKIRKLAENVPLAQVLDLHEPPADLLALTDFLTGNSDREPALTDPELTALVGLIEVQKQNVKGLFLNIKGPELLSKWVGEAEQRIRQIFGWAKREASYSRPVIIFFDEIEAMFQKRGSGTSTDMEKTLVPALLAEMDGVETLENVIVIGATNRAELLDPALLRPGRFDIKIKIDRPDRTAATAILEKYLTGKLPYAAHRKGDDLERHFEKQIAQIVKALQEKSSLVVFPAAATGSPTVVPLAEIFKDAWLAEVSSALRAGPANQRVTFTELANALGLVCRAHQAELQARLGPAGSAKVEDWKIFFNLADADAEALKPNLPTHLRPLDLTEAPDFTFTPGNNALRQMLVDQSIDMLYSSTSFLKVRILAPCKREHTFLLSEFVSGALLADIVARAKRLALKRETSQPGTLDADKGITSADLLQAIRQEYEENREQMVANKPEIGEAVCEVCHRRHNAPDEYDLEVALGGQVKDRWHRPRRATFEKARVNFNRTTAP